MNSKCHPDLNDRRRRRSSAKDDRLRRRTVVEERPHSGPHGANARSANRAQAEVGADSWVTFFLEFKPEFLRTRLELLPLAFGAEKQQNVTC